MGYMLSIEKSPGLAKLVVYQNDPVSRGLRAKAKSQSSSDQLRERETITVDCGGTGRLVVVPVIVKVVPIHIRTVAIAIEIRSDAIAILVQYERARYHLQHRLSKFSRSQG